MVELLSVILEVWFWWVNAFLCFYLQVIKKQNLILIFNFFHQFKLTFYIRLYTFCYFTNSVALKTNLPWKVIRLCWYKEHISLIWEAIASHFLIFSITSRILINRLPLMIQPVTIIKQIKNTTTEPMHKGSFLKKHPLKFLFLKLMPINFPEILETSSITVNQRLLRFSDDVDFNQELRTFIE